MKRHLSEIDLALYASGDLAFWSSAKARFHLMNCEQCKRAIEAFRADRAQMKALAAELPEGIDWDRLSAEMSANIHLGLAAGECVAPRSQSRSVFASLAGLPQGAWRPAVLASLATVGLIVLLGGAWWLNIPSPSQDAATVGRALHAVWQGQRGTGMAIKVEDKGPVVEASTDGIALRENGGSLGMSQGAAEPIMVKVSAEGSASAGYFDKDTGQVTVASVSYVQ